MESLYDNGIVSSTQFQVDPRYKLWLDALLNNALISVMALKAIRGSDCIIEDFEYTFINKKAEESVNRTGLTGKRILEEFPGIATSGLFNNYVEVTETGKPWEGEVYYNYDGYEFWSSVKATKFDDGCLVMYDEITDKIKAQQELLRVKDEIARKATDKFLSLFNSIDQGFCIIEMIYNEDGKAVDYRFLDVNSAFESQTGLKNATGKTIRQMVPNHEEHWFKIYGDVAKSGKPTHFESEAAYLNKYIWYDVYAFRVADPNDHQVAVIFNDTTDRKQAEHQLKEIKENLEKSVEERTLELTEKKEFIEEITKTTPDLITIHDAVSNQIIYANHSNIWQGKFSEEDVYKAPDKKRAQMLIHADDLPKAVEFLKQRRLLADGEILEVELRNEFGNNIWGWIKIRSKVFKRDAEGKAQEIISFTSNITDSKKAETEIKEQAHFIRQVTHTTPDFLYVYDIKNGAIEFLNKDVIKALGYESSAVAGYNFFDQLVHPEDRQKRKHHYANLATLKPNEVRDIEFRVKDKTGNWHWLYARDTYFKADTDGSLTQVLTILQDITEKKEAKAAYLEEKSANEKLRRMNEVMDTFVYAAAHDLKAPISNLKLITEVLSLTTDPEARVKLMDRFHPVLQTLDKTVTGLVNVLAVEKGATTEVKKINFLDVVNQLTQELKVKILHASPDLKTSFAVCEGITYIEPYLFSIFRNMMTNALKYRSDERKLSIVIQSARVDQYILISFKDNGVGIDLESYSNDLFKPFKRFSSLSEGSGIGLHLIKSIVTKNGGKIEVESELNKGTNFKIYLIPYKN